MFTVWNTAARAMWGLQGLGALALKIDNFTQYVGKAPTYTITGAAPNSDIYWSSKKNGQNTGEFDSYYGHKTDGDGNWSTTTGPWPAEHEGNWWKTVRVGNETATVQFEILKQPPATTPPAPAPIYYAARPAPETVDLFGYQVPKLAVWIAAGAVAYKLLGKK